MRTEPNQLAAGVSVLALIALVVSAGVFGGTDAAVRYFAVAMWTMALALVLGQVLLRARRRRPRPLVSPDRPGLGMVLTVFPIVILASAAIPALAPGADYTFMVAIAAVWTAVTLKSALAARRAA